MSYRLIRPGTAKKTVKGRLPGFYGLACVRGGAAVPGPHTRPWNFPGARTAGQARCARPPPPGGPAFHQAVCRGTRLQRGVLAIRKAVVFLMECDTL